MPEQENKITDDKIIKKMRKLLAMAEGTANEHEAMVAAKQLHAMLAKHNISMEEIAGEENPIGEEDFTSNSRPWKRLVARDVAELYFCSFYYVGMSKGKTKYVFVGTEANRTFTTYVFKMIVQTVEKESRRESKKLYGREVSAFVNSFWTGAQRRISKRCQELMESAKQGTLEDEQGNTLPALLSTYEQTKLQLDDYLSQYDLYTKDSRTRATDLNGFQAGKECGSRVQLSRTLKSAPKLLGRN